MAREFDRSRLLFFFGDERLAVVARRQEHVHAQRRRCAARQVEDDLGRVDVAAVSHESDQPTRVRRRRKAERRGEHNEARDPSPHPARETKRRALGPTRLRRVKPQQDCGAAPAAQ